MRLQGFVAPNSIPSYCSYPLGEEGRHGDLLPRICVFSTLYAEDLLCLGFKSLKLTPFLPELLINLSSTASRTWGNAARLQHDIG